VARTATPRELSWTGLGEEMRRMALAIWAAPELGLMESSASRALAGWLETEGFDVETGVAGMDTAFVATAGEGSRTIGFLLEYDALPALGNAAVRRREPLAPNAPGHACGHNLIGSANAAAAIAVKRAASSLGLGGRVVAYGTPAEEILVGKVAMLDSGVFDGCDVLLTHHADYDNAATSRPCQSIVHFEVAFRGRAAHTGVVRAQNALDAAELLVQTVERLRAHQFSGTSIEHALRFPTYVMPSNTPEEVRVWFYVRNADYDVAERAYRRILEQARAAAEAVGVRHQAVVVSSCRGYLPNDVLGRLLFDELGRVGPPAWDEADIGFLRELAEAYTGEPRLTLARGLAYLDDGVDAYGQDDGELSWHIPLGRVNYACPEEIPLHSWAATALFSSDAAAKGAEMCAQALAQAGLRLLADPALVSAARAELERRSPEPPPRSVAGAWGAMLADPARFWEGSWAFPAEM